MSGLHCVGQFTLRAQRTPPNRTCALSASGGRLALGTHCHFMASLRYAFLISSSVASLPTPSTCMRWRGHVPPLTLAPQAQAQAGRQAAATLAPNIARSQTLRGPPASRPGKAHSQIGARAQQPRSSPSCPSPLTSPHGKERAEGEKAWREHGKDEKKCLVAFRGYPCAPIQSAAAEAEGGTVRGGRAVADPHTLGGPPSVRVWAAQACGSFLLDLARQAA